MGLNLTLEVGRTSLISRQQQLAVVANNLANAGKTGYHKQDAILNNNMPVTTNIGQMGTGAHVEAIVRAFDQALENNLQTAITQSGEDSIYAQKLNSIEAATAPDGSSRLAEIITDFGSSLQTLSTQPESTDARETVLFYAESVTSEFNRLHGDILTIRDNIADASNTGEIADKLNEINRLAGEIAQLNDDISFQESRLFNAGIANDLRDERDSLVKQIAQYVDITVTEETDYTYTVTLGGHELVSGGTSDSLNLDMSGGSPAFSWTSDSSAAAISSGEIFGLVQAFNHADTLLTDYETFAAQLSTIVNTQHNLGTDLNGAPGADLFDASTPGAMQVLISTPDELAASLTAAIGDGSNMLAIWDAMNSSVAALNQDSVFEHSNNLVDAIALEFRNAKSRASVSESSVLLFTEAVQRNSGVNVDEEMIGMLEVQRGFQAAARVVTTVDELLGIVIGLV
ncbi:MAG: flagellar hook-associated protein FlgK [Lentisphaeria bacterium]|nr:flagellar hook-associated protein FlgK [Lentisphaeria bacterium]NQZ70014.1 flagellar hook-associated protein FlgK [Lentisphaeria bacterium]